MKLEGTVHARPPSLLTPIASLGDFQNRTHVKKFSRRTQNSLKVVLLIVTIYYREGIKIKISQEKMGIRQSLGVAPNIELLLSSPHGVMDSVTFLAVMCDDTHGALPSRGHTPASILRSFY